MSIQQQTVEVPATTRTERTTVCDICGKTNATDNPHVGESDWHAEPKYGRDAYKRVVIQSTHVEIGYESDGSSEGDAWDICPGCFEERVRPLLLSLAKPRKVDISW